MSPQPYVFAFILLFVGSACHAEHPPTKASSEKMMDLSIMGVELGNPAKTTLRPTEFNPRSNGPLAGFRVANYYNATRQQMFSVLKAEGAETGNFQGYVVAITDQPLILVPILKDVTEFSTGKGIRLGMKQAQVVKRLGSPSHETKDGETITLKYIVENLSAFSQLAGRSYASEYEFSDDKLTSIFVKLN